MTPTPAPAADKPGLAALLGVTALTVSLITVALTYDTSETSDSFLVKYAAITLGLAGFATGLGWSGPQWARAFAAVTAVGVSGYQMLMLGYIFLW